MGESLCSIQRTTRVRIITKPTRAYNSVVLILPTCRSIMTCTTTTVPIECPHHILTLASKYRLCGRAVYGNNPGASSSRALHLTHDPSKLKSNERNHANDTTSPRSTANNWKEPGSRSPSDSSSASPTESACISSFQNGLSNPTCRKL